MSLSSYRQGTFNRHNSVNTLRHTAINSADLAATNTQCVPFPRQTPPLQCVDDKEISAGRVPFVRCCHHSAGAGVIGADAQEWSGARRVSAWHGNSCGVNQGAGIDKSRWRGGSSTRNHPMKHSEKKASAVHRSHKRHPSIALFPATRSQPRTSATVNTRIRQLRHTLSCFMRNDKSSSMPPSCTIHQTSIVPARVSSGVGNR